jgi:hypothetical protein
VKKMIQVKIGKIHYQKSQTCYLKERRMIKRVFQLVVCILIFDVGKLSAHSTTQQKCALLFKGRLAFGQFFPVPKILRVNRGR